MTSLLIEDGGWNVMTTAWTAAAKPNRSQTEICYAWSSMSGMGFTENSTGVTRMTLNIPFNIFAAHVAACDKQGIPADLTNGKIPGIIAQYQRKGQGPAPVL